MYIKIYFGDKPLFLTDSIDETVQPYVHHDDAVFIDELDTHMIKTIIHEMQEPQVHSGVFFNPDLDKLFKAFKKKFTLIQAAGGLVKNEKEQMLMIFRRGSWDLPKGKLDKGEKLENCALREVKEETGLEEVQLISPLTTTYHTYHEGTKFILKESHWFVMNANGNQNLKPQLEEGIHEIKWVKKNEVDNYLAKAYPMISDIIGSHNNLDKRISGDVRDK
jgi:8-oxo-dGTP pyrophosphatase MutT (NUDIX family)